MQATISDVVAPIEHADLVNDVRLDAYPSDPSNLALSERYIFTQRATAGHISSIDLLKELTTTLLYPRENRYVAIATYGHGKSHLALALANFFGKPIDSPEVQALLNNIDHAADAPVARSLRDFKEGRAPYLIVRLRGDQPASLDQQFVRGVELALREAAVAPDARLPFWFPKAERFLKSLSAEEETTANGCLQEHGTDVAQLRKQVAERDPAVYDTCREVFRWVRGDLPDWATEVSLQQVVEWVTDTYCGDGKPLSGVVVLFDEFSAFIRRYADRRRGGAGTPLQDLLNGIANRQGRAVFLAFSQHDPDSVARSAARDSLLDDREDDITKELERLPYPQRKLLYSSLETVLDAYLKQDEAAWESLLDQPDFLEACQTATDLTMQLVAPVYEDVKWGPEIVFEVLTKGCFPLHPLTSALLCNVGFKERTNPRSVLGFVCESLSKVSGQPAIVDGHPNWIYPVALVDWFTDMLADREYAQYQAARDQAGAEIPPIQLAVLKAMLLYSVGQLKSRRRYVRAITQLTGYVEKECQTALEELHGGGYIRFDEVQAAYTFYAAGAVAAKLEETIRARIGDQQLDGAKVMRLNFDWQESGRLKPISVDGCPWGHPEDLAARQVVLPARYFSVENIRRFAEKFRWDPRKGIVDEPRGTVIWIVPETEAKLEQVRANAERTLDEALDGTPMPVILGIPTEPRPYFEAHVLRELELKNLPVEIKREHPAEVRQDVERRYTGAVDAELEHIKDGPSYVVPLPYRPRFRAEAQVGNMTVRRALTICYKEAYKSSPPKFQTQYRAASGTNLRKAVNLVCRHVADDSLTKASQALSVAPVARDLVNDVLARGATGSWGILSVERSITPPTSVRIAAAWEFISSQFPAGEEAKPLRAALIPLLNPPFGYDYNQLAILFCAWYGYHRSDIELLTSTEYATSLAEFYPQLDRPREFISKLCELKLVLKDRSAAVQEIEQLADTVSRAAPEQLTRTEAEALRSKLALFAGDEQQEDGLRKRAQSAANKLERAVQVADQYVAQAKEVEEAAQNASALAALVKSLRQIESLPALGVVGVEVPAPSALKEAVIGRMTRVVESQCRKWEKLTAITQYDLNRRELQAIGAGVKGAGREELVARVDAALRELLSARQALQAEQEDAWVVNAVRTISAAAPLAQMRADRQALKEFRPKLEQTKAVIDSKAIELESAIEREERFARELQTHVDALATVDQARKLQTEIQRRLDRYAGTEEQGALDQALARAQELEECFREVDALGRLDPKSPAEARSLIKKLKDIEKRSAKLLSAQQHAQFEVARAAVEQGVAKKQQSAEQWLEDLKRENARDVKPDLLLRELDNQPPFLPDGCTAELTAFRQRVQERLDADEVLQVTLHFRKIVDKARRAQCLAELLTISEEMER